jgi:Ca2+/Na+ antiporter
MKTLNKLSLAKIWRDYNLSVVLGVLFIISWIGQFIFQSIAFSNEQASMGETFEYAAFIPAFLASTLENWQSEFLQLLSIVVLSAYFVYKGSHESKDSEEKIEKKLEEINNKLDSLMNK